jgi:hypothetical protein
VSSYDPTDLRGQETIKADKAAKDRLAKEVEDSDLKWLMSNKRGRRIVWRLLEQSGVFRLSFNTNAMTMAFAEGNRNFGNRTLAQIHSLCPELYPVLVKENSANVRATTETAETKTEAATSTPAATETAAKR